MKKRKRLTPLTISIHGRGVDIDAKVSDGPGLSTLIAGLAGQLASRSSAEPTAAPFPSIEHDFDVMQRVVKHASVDVLQAFAKLVEHELQTRAAA